MPLSDIAIKKAKPTMKAYRLDDSGGLFCSSRPLAARTGDGNICSTANKI